jgi:hypothetical protein
MSGEKAEMTSLEPSNTHHTGLWNPLWRYLRAG